MDESVYIQNGINGEKVLFDKMTEFQSYASEYLRPDLKNIRFYDPDNNKLLKHYLIDNQGIKNFIFEVPYEKVVDNNSDDIIDTVTIFNSLSDYEGVNFVSAETLANIGAGANTNSWTMRFEEGSSHYALWGSGRNYGNLGFYDLNNSSVEIRKDHAVGEILTAQEIIDDGRFADFNPKITSVILHQPSWFSSIRFTYNLVDESTNDYEILIMPKTYEYEGSTSIFKSIHNFKKTGTSTPTNGNPVWTIENGEDICATQVNRPVSITIGKFPYKDIVHVQSAWYSGSRSINGTRDDLNMSPNSHDTQPVGVKNVAMGTDIGTPQLYINGENSNTIIRPSGTFSWLQNTWKTSRLLMQNEHLQYYDNYNDKENKAEINTQFDDGQYFYWSKWSSGYVNTSLVLGMQNPYQTINKPLEVSNLQFIENDYDGNGTWNILTSEHSQYTYDDDKKSRELKITFDDIDIEDYKDLLGIVLMFDRKKLGGMDKFDNKVVLEVNGQTSINKSIITKYQEGTETVIYGGVYDKWGLNLTSVPFTDITVSYQIKNGDSNRESVTVVDIYNPTLIVYYKYYDYTDYPIFSHYKADNKFYQTIDTINGKKTWIKEPYRLTGANVKIPMPSYLPQKVNVHTNVKYLDSSSWYKQHWYGLGASEPEDEMVLGVNDKLHLLSSNFNLYDERIVKLNNRVDNTIGQTSINGEHVRGLYYDFVMKYLQDDIIVQSKAGTMKRNKEE